MRQLKEEFRLIKGKEWLPYKISNYGKIKVDYGWYDKENIYRDIIKPIVDIDSGYHYVYLFIEYSFNGSLFQKDYQVKFYISRLVWDTFGNRLRNGHILEVDHKDNNKLNNRIDNLQTLTHKMNCIKGHIQRGKKTSKYTGVSWVKRDKVWRVHIEINKKPKHLGDFRDEFKAHLKYEEALKEISLKEDK